MESGSTHLHVVPSLDGGWVLRETADGPALRRTTTQRGVLNTATLMLARRQGGQITVHANDGTRTTLYDVKALGRRPWWYQPPRILSLLSQPFLIVIAVAWLVDDTPAAPQWIAVLVLAIALFSFASYVGSWVLDRRRGPVARVARAEAEPQEGIDSLQPPK